MEEQQNKHAKTKSHLFVWIVLGLLGIALVAAGFLLGSGYIHPELELVGEPVVQVEVFDSYTTEGCKASVLGLDVSDKLGYATDVDTNKVGAYSETFTYGFFGKTYSKKRVIEVVDTVPPEVMLMGGDMTISAREEYWEPGYGAYDQYDGDLAAQVQITESPVEGGILFTYAVADSSGNTGQAQRMVTIVPKAVSADGNSVIYLTFDDGPSSRITSKVLDILKANQVKATFFIVNYSDDKKPIIQRAIDEGHAIGIHGYSHDYGTIYQSEEAFVNNVETLHQRLINDFGYDTHLMRFPGGSSNEVSRKYCKGIMTSLVQKMPALGYHYYDWNVSSGDAAGGTVPAAGIYANVTSGLRHNRGNVVLMHDTDAKGTTAAALQDIITYGKNRGYTFAPLSPGNGEYHHRVSN